MNQLSIKSHEYDEIKAGLNDPVECRQDHIDSILHIQQSLKKDPYYLYCKFFYDTLYDLLRAGY